MGFFLFWLAGTIIILAMPPDEPELAKITDDMSDTLKIIVEAANKKLTDVYDADKNEAVSEMDRLIFYS
jgi:hypothetical protein